MVYEAAETRYDRPDFYHRCGNSGLRLPRISLGLWHNFGDNERFADGRTIVRRAFDLGVTHFDLANNYGPPPGAAELNFGRLIREDLAPYRDELIISSKAGYGMWSGPYGDWGSRKYLMASLDQSLTRLGLDYVDIFYHHRPDPETPLEETMGALTSAVQQGKALYVGLSNYGPEDTAKAVKILRANGTPCLIHQPKYSMYERTPENGLFEVLEKEGIGCIPFSPLAQGLLTPRYLKGIPEDARAGRYAFSLRREDVTEEKIAQLRQLNELAEARGQSLAQMALAWVLRQPSVTTALIGASKVSQLENNIAAVNNLTLTDDELERIEKVLGS